MKLDIAINYVCYWLFFVSTLEQNKKDGKYQETIQSSTTPDPGYHMDK